MVACACRPPPRRQHFERGRLGHLLGVHPLPITLGLSFEDRFTPHAQAREHDV